MTANLRKLWIKLDSKDGYPPVDAETLWVERQGDCWRIDNIPFYAPGLSYGDLVEASEGDGKLWLTGVAVFSSFSTIRVMSYAASTTSKIKTELIEMGCKTEASNLPDFLAISIPSDVALEGVQSLLAAYHSRELLDYEESSLRQKPQNKLL